MSFMLVRGSFFFFGSVFCAFFFKQVSTLRPRVSIDCLIFDLRCICDMFIADFVEMYV
jgi:hypothetical protein